MVLWVGRTEFVSLYLCPCQVAAELVAEAVEVAAAWVAAEVIAELVAELAVKAELVGVVSPFLYPSPDRVRHQVLVK